jgi:hypothetical protein
VCIPFVTAIRQQLQVLEKRTRQMRPQSRNFLWRCAAGKKALAGLSAERKKGHFSVKKCDLGSW